MCIRDRNPDASGIRRCYLSGRAETDSYGSAKVRKGHDSVAPGRHPDDTAMIQLYRNFDAEDETGALPVHDCCLRVLQRAAKYGAGGPPIEDADFGFQIDDGLAFEVEQEDDHTNEGDQPAADSSLGPKSVERVKKLDIDALFHCISSRRVEYRSSLQLDYGPMTDMANEQYFYLERENQVGLRSFNQRCLHGSGLVCCNRNNYW